MNGIGIDLDFSAAAVAFGSPPILVFLIAVVVDALLGGVVRNRLPWFLKPAVLVDQLAQELERRLNREFRSTATRLIRGLILLLILGVPVALIAAFIERAVAALPFAWVVELIVIVGLVAPRAPAATPILGDSAARMHRLGLSAALIRQLGERINSGFVAAAFWFVFLGVVGLAVYWVVNIVVVRASSGDTQDAVFSFAAARFHEAIAIIPAFVSGLLIIAASAFVPQARVGTCLRERATLAGRAAGESLVAGDCTGRGARCRGSQRGRRRPDRNPAQSRGVPLWAHHRLRLRIVGAGRPATAFRLTRLDLFGGKNA